MQHVFQKVLELSMTGSVIALAVMGIRLLFRNAPKWMICLLWGLVALRLMCPVSIESGFSLMPQRIATGQIISNMADTPLPDEVVLSTPEGVTETIPREGGFFQEDAVPHEPTATVGGRFFPWLSLVWLVGMLGMLDYAVISYLMLKGKMAEATRLRENIWQSEQAEMPFVLGFLKPRIYLPYHLSEEDISPVIAHERTHILRKDHWWKLLGFLLLSVYWFNPVLWAAYCLLCRDIESACDEKVIRDMEKQEKQAYSTALLHCSIRRRAITACPLAFGEVGVKERVKHVMRFKKPGFWMVLIALLVCVAVAVCFLTNPIDVLEYRIDCEIGTQQTEFLQAYNRKHIGIIVTVQFESTEGPSEVQLVHGNKKNGFGEEWTYSDPIVLLPGESAVFSVPADHHFFLMAVSADGDRGNVTFLITEKNRLFSAADQTEEHAKLTLSDLILLSERGADLTWDDFRDYPHEDVGSGLFIFRFSINDAFCLDIVGGDPGMENPMGFYLRSLDGSDAYIDIREGDVAAFIRKHSGEKKVTMVPTDSRNTGIFDRYLYLTIDGEKYRFERQEIMPVGIQAGPLMETVYEDDGLGNRYAYSVFSVKNVTDNSMFLVHSEDMDMMWLYRYSSAKAVDPAVLQQAKDSGYVVMEDGDPTYGKELWQDFYDKTQQGIPSKVTVVHYHTLDSERCSEQYYEAYREDYPMLYLYELTFDGETYRIQSEDMDRKYEYLMRYDIRYPNTIIDQTEYILTHDNRVTWEELFLGIASSQPDAYIDHYTIYRDAE